MPFGLLPADCAVRKLEAKDEAGAAGAEGEQAEGQQKRFRVVGREGGAWRVGPLGDIEKLRRACRVVLVFDIVAEEGILVVCVLRCKRIHSVLLAFTVHASRKIRDVLIVINRDRPM